MQHGYNLWNQVTKTRYIYRWLCLTLDSGRAEELLLSQSYSQHIVLSFKFMIWLDDIQLCLVYQGWAGVDRIAT